MDARWLWRSVAQFFCMTWQWKSVIDFGGVPVFGAAMVDTCHRAACQAPQSGSFPSYVADDAARWIHPSDYFEITQYRLGLDGAPWVVMSPERQRIKLAVEQQGVPLEKWQIQINAASKPATTMRFTSVRRSATRSLRRPTLR
jgi:hypothetical protein